MARAGRKRKPGKREANGRPSRATAKLIDPASVARSARERVHGVAKADSGTELAGTAIGRLFLTGLIRRRHVEAAVIIADRRQAYARAIDLGRTEPQAVDVHAVHGRANGDIDPQTARRNIELWDEIVLALDAAGRRGHLYAVVWQIVISDRDNLRDTDLLRTALDVIADVVRLPLDNLREAA